MLCMVNDVCGCAIGLCVKVYACSKSPDDTMRLPLLWMGFHVGNPTKDDMVDQVTSPFPMDRQDITTLRSACGFMVVVEEAFWFSYLWFHWTCRIVNGIRQGKHYFQKVFCKTNTHIIMLLLVLLTCSRRFRRSGVDKRKRPPPFGDGLWILLKRGIEPLLIPNLGKL